MDFSLTQHNQNENLLFQVSLAESLLNEYFREESLYKAINIFKEILESDVEKNSKNILNIIISKLIDIYLKSSNRTKYLINNLIFSYRNKFTTIFLNKDISDKLIAIVTCSDCLARCYSLQLISYLPGILEKRLDLLHMIFDLYISNKSLLEEKLVILNLFEIIIRNGNNENLQSLLLENFEKMINVLSCKKCGFIIFCEKCKKIKIKFLKIFRNIDIMYSKSVIVSYIENFYKIENYRISSILYCSLEKENFFNKLINKFLDSNEANDAKDSDDEHKLIILNYFEISNNLDEKFLLALLSEQSFKSIKNFTQNKLYICKRFTLTIFLSLLDDQISINNILSNKTSLEQMIKIVFLLSKIYSKNSEFLINLTNNLSEKNLKQFFNFFITFVSKNNFKLNLDNFFNGKNIGNFINLINTFKFYNNLNQFYQTLLNIFIKIFQSSLSEYDSHEENLRYIYFLDILMANIKFDQKEILKLFIEPIYLSSSNKELVGKCLKKLISKYKLELDLTSLKCLINELKPDDIIKEYRNFKEVVLLGDVEKASKYNLLIKNSVIFSDSSKDYLQRFNMILINISNFISNISKDMIEIENLFKLQIQDQIKYIELERNALLTQYSKDIVINQFNFLKSLILIKNYFSENSYNKIYDELDNFMNSHTLLLLSSENKLDTYIDLKAKCLNSSTISLFSDFIEKEINNLIKHFTRFILIINPIFDIQISTQFKKSNQVDSIFLIQSRLQIVNPMVYLRNINNIVFTVYINFVPVKEIELRISKKNWLINDIVIPYTKKKKNQLEEVTLSYSLSFIHDEFFKFTFYEHRVQLTI